MEFIVNEVKHVEKILEEKRVTPRKVMKELRLVIQYHLSKGETKDNVVEKVVRFMNDVNGNNNGENWRTRIESMVIDVINKKNYELRDIEEVYITKNELQVIKQLKSKPEQRYAFGLLVYCKIFNYKKQGRFVRIESTTNFAKNSDVNLKAMDREILFNRLQDNGLINVPRKTGSDSIEVIFVDYEGEVEIKIPVEDIDKFIYYYYQWSGDGKLKHCKECGARVLVRAKNTKYCKKCSKEKELEKTRERMRKCRENR